MPEEGAPGVQELSLGCEKDWEMLEMLEMPAEAGGR